jgi:hypothetical protein
MTWARARRPSGHLLATSMAPGSTTAATKRARRRGRGILSSRGLAAAAGQQGGRVDIGAAGEAVGDGCDDRFPVRAEWHIAVEEHGEYTSSTMNPTAPPVLLSRSRVVPVKLDLTSRVATLTKSVAAV